MSVFAMSIFDKIRMEMMGEINQHRPSQECRQILSAASKRINLLCEDQRRQWISMINALLFDLLKTNTLFVGDISEPRDSTDQWSIYIFNIIDLLISHGAQLGKLHDNPQHHAYTSLTHALIRHFRLTVANSEELLQFFRYIVDHGAPINLGWPHLSLFDFASLCTDASSWINLLMSCGANPELHDDPFNIGPDWDISKGIGPHPPQGPLEPWESIVWTPETMNVGHHIDCEDSV